MRLAESDMKCRKHCNTRFGNYLELIDHFEGHGLQRYLLSRTFICPVKECPMNMIGFDKRAELRHHVHSDHVTHGLVSIQYAKYSEEIKKFLFVCDEENCGKGFYRSDTLTRHIKLVHKREKHFTKRKRRQVVAHQEDKAIKNRKVSSFRPPTLYGKRIKFSVLKQKKFLFFILFFLCICFDFTIQFYSPFVIHSFVGWLVGW